MLLFLLWAEILNSEEHIDLVQLCDINARMKKVLLALVALIIVAVVGLLIAVSLQPASFSVERSVKVNAPAFVTYDWVDDYKSFAKWNPWFEMDPNVVLEFSGPAAGLGAAYTWKGNDEVGEGKMKIIGAEKNARIDHDLNFITPFESNAKTSMIVKAVEGGSTMTWTMQGKNDFAGKAFSLLMNMEEAIGKDYEKGLSKFKTLVEADNKKRKAMVKDAKALAEKMRAVKAADENQKAEAAQ